MLCRLTNLASNLSCAWETLEIFHHFLIFKIPALQRWWAAGGFFEDNVSTMLGEWAATIVWCSQKVWTLRRWWVWTDFRIRAHLAEELKAAGVLLGYLCLMGDNYNSSLKPFLWEFSYPCCYVSGVRFSLQSNVFVLCLSDNSGLCSACNKCYLVRPRLDPLTSHVVLFVCFAMVWSGSDHMFCIFCAENSSVSPFSKVLVVFVTGKGCCLFLASPGPGATMLTTVLFHSYLCMLPCRRLAGVPVF